MPPPLPQVLIAWYSLSNGNLQYVISVPLPGNHPSGDPNFMVMISSRCSHDLKIHPLKWSSFFILQKVIGVPLTCKNPPSPPPPGNDRYSWVGKQVNSSLSHKTVYSANFGEGRGGGHGGWLALNITFKKFIYVSHINLSQIYSKVVPVSSHIGTKYILYCIS